MGATGRWPSDARDVHVPVERGKHDAGVVEDDPRDGAGELAEAVAVIGAEDADGEEGGEVEDADGAVEEPAREVPVREGDSPARMRVVPLGGRRRAEQQGRVHGPPVVEIGSGAVEVDVLITPRGTETPVAGPDPTGEILPQELRVGNGEPRGTYLSCQ